MLSVPDGTWSHDLQPVIAVDGMAGAGKSTAAGAVSRHFHIPLLNTGLMYRAVASYLVRNGLVLEDLVSGLPRQDGQLQMRVEGERAWVDGVELTDLRTPAVVDLLPRVSAAPEVRRHLVALQRTWISDHGLGVVEGRDIGSVVFPCAFVKVFFVASDAARIARRPEEREKVIVRDRLDSTRAISPSKPAGDAIVVDTTEMTRTEVADRIIRLVEYRIHEILGTSAESH